MRGGGRGRARGAPGVTGTSTAPYGRREIVTLGETMALVRAVEDGSLSHVRDARFGIGGAESNVAIGLARLGVPAAWLGRLGDDGFGRRVARELRAEGVRVVGILDPDAPTGLMVKETPRPGRTSVLYYRSGSAGSRLESSDLAGLGIQDAARLHVTGITCALSRSAADALGTAVEIARGAGVPVSFDVNHRSRLWRDDSYVARYRELVRAADVVFAGEDEAAILVPEAVGPRRQAEAIGALGPRSVVVKLGARGALALDDGAVTELPAVPVTVVDTVGAGDAFVAGWLAEWWRGSPGAVRLDVATRAGAFACLHPGDWEGLPTTAELAETAGDPVAR